MIGNKSIRQAASENANGSLPVPVENDPTCEGCKYYARLGSGSSQMACHYLLIEGRRRPCDPGKDCTVKVLGEYPGYDPSEWCHDGRKALDELFRRLLK